MMTPGTMDVSNLSVMVPYLIQFGLACICVAIIQRLKIYEHFPFLTEVTDRANTLASVGLALFIAAAFQAKAIYMHWGTGKNLIWAGKDAAVQWGLQEMLYRVGLKNALKNLFSMIGIGPAIAKSSTETHSSTTAEDGTVTKVDAVKTVIVEAPIPEAKPAEPKL